jgi:5-methylcytosine-specific restriction endonuclease McrA
MTEDKNVEKASESVSWEEAEDVVLRKALKAVEKELNPYVFEEGAVNQKTYRLVKFTHKELLSAVPLFQKRRDILIALNTEKSPADGFYKSRAWYMVRYKVLTDNKATCNCCGDSGRSVSLHVDHIKPRSKYPELELEQDNLQVLCEACNMGKSNVDETDWRGAACH